MKRKAIFIDLDETLLTSDKKISNKNADALHRMLDEGHVVAFNTGRPTRAVKTITEPYGFNRNGCYYMGFHGSVIMDAFTNETIKVNSAPADEAIKLMKAFEEKGIYTQCFDENYLITTTQCDTLEEYNKVTHEPVLFIKTYDELLTHNITKVMGIDYNDHDRLADFQEYYRTYEEGVFNSFFSCTPYLEYTKLGSNKGLGLRTLAEYLNIDIIDTIACGDERNDIPMIEAAGVGVAMKNAHEECRKTADYITENDNNHDGIAEVIEKFVFN